MMNRRRFIKVAGSAVFGSLLGYKLGCMSEASNGVVRRSLENIGLQLYTVRELMKKEFQATLEKVAAIGYKEVEFAGYFGHEPREVRKLLDDLGLAAPATHLSIQVLRDKLPKLIEAAKIIGHRYLVCPWISPKERTLENYQAMTELFNKIGEKCREEGLQFAYHNHDFEFEAIDGQVPYDILLEGTDPELVQMELDLFWIKKTGKDPIAYFEKYKNRFPLCHVKDMTNSGKMVDVGQGKIDFAAIFSKSSQAGLKHFFVEHDEPVESLKSIETSFKYLKQLEF